MHPALHPPRKIARLSLVFGLVLASAIGSGIALRFLDLHQLGLAGSDTVLYTTVAEAWARGNHIYRIGPPRDPVLTPRRRSGGVPYRPALYHAYATAVRILGFHDYSIKFLNAAADSASVLVLFLTCYLLAGRNVWPALAAAATYALLPMAIEVSRTELPHAISGLMIQSSFLFFVLGIRAVRARMQRLFVALSGLFVGLAALTHEELLLAGGGYVVLLIAGVLFGSRRPAKVRLALVNAAIFVTCMSIVSVWLPLNRYDIVARETSPMEMVEGLAAPGGNTAYVVWPFQVFWSAVTANSSPLVSYFLLLLIILTAVAIARMKSWGLRVSTPVASSFYAPLVIVLTHTTLYSFLIAWMYPRYFLPLIPLILASLSIWAWKILQASTGRLAPAILTSVNLLVVACNVDYYGASTFRTTERGAREWAPAAIRVHLDLPQGYKSLRSRTYTQTWARARWEELKDRVSEDSRLLVTSSIMYPWRGCRVFQVGYYFGDDASYLLDHDEPLDDLVRNLNIEYLLFTSHFGDTQVLGWETFERYQYGGKWGSPKRQLLGASYGFGPGEYTVAGEYRFLRRYLEDSGARVLLASGDFLRKRPKTFDPSNPAYVVYALDPESSPDFRAEAEAIESSERLFALGDIEAAEQTLRAALEEVIGLGRLRLRLQMISLYQAAGRPYDTLAELDFVVNAVPQDTSLSTVIGGHFNSRPEVDTAIERYNDLLQVDPENVALKAILASLHLLRIEHLGTAGEGDLLVRSFRALGELTREPVLSGVHLAIADWCLRQAEHWMTMGSGQEASAARAAAKVTFERHIQFDAKASYKTYLSLGRMLSDESKHDEGIALLRGATALAPSEGEGWVSLCLAYQRGDRPEEAIPACRRAIELAPDHYYANSILAELHVTRSEWLDAIPAAKRAVELAPTDAHRQASLILLARAQLGKAALLRTTAQIDEATQAEFAALAVYEEIAAFSPQPQATVLLGHGRFLSDLKRHDEGIALLRQATALAPSEGEVWVNLCLAYQRAEHTEEAIPACRQAIELAPDHYYANSILAELHVTRSEWPDAIAAAKRAAELAPTDAHREANLILLARAQLGKAALLRTTAQIDEATDAEFAALAVYEKIAAFSPQPQATVLLGHGRLLSDLKRHDEGIALLRQATALAPSEGEVWVNLCLAYQRAEHTEEAIPACRQGIELAPRHYYARSILAELHVTRAEWPDAIPAAKRAAELAPTDAHREASLVLLARAYARTGSTAKACATLRGAGSSGLQLMGSLGCSQSGTN